MRTWFATFLLLALVGTADSGAAPQKDKRRAAMIYKPFIDYPYKARRAGITGSGVVAVDVEHVTGKVVRAYMLKSTGSSILDDAAISAFRQAKFLPGSFDSPIKIPISFGGRPPKNR